MGSLNRLEGAPVVEEELLVPAVPVRKSVTPDYIISLEDGRKFKSLKRHLNSQHGMTPDQYRAKWNLPSDYPMVAGSTPANCTNILKDLSIILGNEAISKSALGNVSGNRRPKKKPAEFPQPA